MESSQLQERPKDERNGEEVQDLALIPSRPSDLQLVLTSGPLSHPLYNKGRSQNSMVLVRWVRGSNSFSGEHVKAVNANAVSDTVCLPTPTTIKLSLRKTRLLASLGDAASDFRRQYGAFVDSISSTLNKMKTQLVKPTLGRRVLNNVVTIATYSGIHTSP